MRNHIRPCAMPRLNHASRDRSRPPRPFVVPSPPSLSPSFCDPSSLLKNALLPSTLCSSGRLLLLLAVLLAVLWAVLWAVPHVVKHEDDVGVPTEVGVPFDSAPTERRRPLAGSPKPTLVSERVR